MPILELTFFGVFFLVGLILIEFGWNNRNPILSLAGGVVWLVLGVLSLTGQVIMSSPSTISNVTYSSINGSLVISLVNQTTTLIPLTQSSDPVSLATAGLMGFVLVGLGVFFVWLSVMELGRMREPKSQDEA
jgi:drug/metabolite transporter (DMT)-like permease